MSDETPKKPAAGKKKKDKKPGNRTAFTSGAQIELGNDGGFRITLPKAELAMLFDQSESMLEGAGQGCISAPGGPSC